MQRVAVDVVDEDVETPLLALDSIEKLLDFLRLRVIDANSDSDATTAIDHLGGLVNRFRPLLRDQISARAASGAVDRCASLAQHPRDPAAGSARRSGDNCDFPIQRLHGNSLGS